MRCARNITTRRTTVTRGGWVRTAKRSAPTTTESLRARAGKPILGQLLSNELVNCLIVVVRYFGGTKLGVSGLIGAYKESAAEAIRAAEIVERTVDTVVEVEFSYLAMNDVMRVVKEEQPRVLTQQFDNLLPNDAGDPAKSRRRYDRQTGKNRGRDPRSEIISVRPGTRTAQGPDPRKKT